MLILAFLISVQSLELFTGSIVGAGAVLGAAVFSVYKPIICKVKECCQPPWIEVTDQTINSLQEDLELNVFGQQIAID